MEIRELTMDEVMVISGGADAYCVGVGTENAACTDGHTTWALNMDDGGYTWVSGGKLYGYNSAGINTITVEWAHTYGDIAPIGDQTPISGTNVICGVDASGGSCIPGPWV